MTAAVDLDGSGTPEAVWVAAGLPERLPRLDPGELCPEHGKVVVVAPHPDDEVLGTGGLLAQLARLATRDAAIEIVAVTDGEASHPGRADSLRDTRAAERSLALRRLGLGAATVHRLSQPDGGVNDAAVAERLAELVAPGDLLLAPWERDGHPDHDACGRAAAMVPARRWAYLVWAWHWARPAELPWQLAGRVELAGPQAARKRRAVAAFRSQLEGERPILPPHVLVRLTRSSEVLFESEGAR